jgi:hypothetical protein
MKGLTIALLFVVFSFTSWSQDAIMKRDGSKIDAKVVEITSTTIKYRNFDQPDGPLRNIAINDVQEIIYENGTWEKFEKTAKVETTESTEKVQPTRKPKDAIFENGFFLEGMLGMNSIKQTSSYSIYSYYDEFGNYIEEKSPARESYASLSIRIGNKWYFGSREKWRPGIQLTYFKLGLYLNPNSNYAVGRNSMSLANVGFANIFKFSEKIGLEANANVGFTVLNFLPPWNIDPTPGINYGVAVKFRYKALAVGLDYSRMEANFNSSSYTSMDIISLSIGAKF